MSADSISTLSVAEPNRKSAIGEIETVIKRVVRDDSLGLMGFEVELSNRGQSDYYLDHEGFAVRVGEARYEQSISDCGGIVPAGTSVSGFLCGQPTPQMADKASWRWTRISKCRSAPRIRPAIRP